MRRPWIIAAALCFLTTTALAAPKYEEDPFEDEDFIDAPLILDVAHPTRGRGELAVMYAGSAIDKYSSHQGLSVDFNYHFLDTFGVGLSVGLLHGSLTNIVTSGEGIIGNKMAGCLSAPAADCNLNPNVPDYKQVTGLISLSGIWSPLYGKINIVSEIDLNLQFYALGGIGVNGTRTVTAEKRGDAVATTDFDLNGNGFLAGGFLSDPKFNGHIGLGLRVYLLDWITLRAEFKGLFFLDKFDFDTRTGVDGTLQSADGVEETYMSSYFFTQVGLGFILF